MPSEYVPTLDSDTFAFINTQPSNMQGEHWVMIANFHHKLFFVDSRGRPSFVKQQYKQFMPEPLQNQPSVRGLYVIYAVFPLLEFRREKITGVHDVKLLSFISICM